MHIKNSILIWVCVSAAVLAFVYVFGSVLLPFALGLAVAYLLNPISRAMQARGFTAMGAAGLILFLFFALVGILGAVLLPVLWREAAQFAADAPGYATRIMAMAEPYTKKIQIMMGASPDAAPVTAQSAGTAFHFINEILAGAARGGQAMLGFIYVVSLTPVVAYFMLAGWNSMTHKTIDIIPPRRRSVVLDILSKIDTKLGAFVRGQLGVIFLLGFLYAVLLSLAGLKYGFVIGLGAGLLSIIPFFGSTLGLMVGVAVAFFQTGDWNLPLIVAAIFLGGQLLDGNFLTPYLVGKSVGLHPLWIFFAIMAGASLFGILGMLIAVPVAIVVSVLCAHGLAQYKSSLYYNRDAS